MKYAPRKVYIIESGSYVELSYTDFCRRRQADQSYMDKLFIPVQGCLLEVVREQYTDFYRDKERWRYLKKLDTSHKLLSLEGFTDSEGNALDFVIDETVNIAETVVHAPGYALCRGQRQTRPVLRLPVLRGLRGDHDPQDAESERQGVCLLQLRQQQAHPPVQPPLLQRGEAGGDRVPRHPRPDRGGSPPG